MNWKELLEETDGIRHFLYKTITCNNEYDEYFVVNCVEFHMNGDIICGDYTIAEKRSYEQMLKIVNLLIKDNTERR